MNCSLLMLQVTQSATVRLRFTPCVRTSMPLDTVKRVSALLQGVSYLAIGSWLLLHAAHSWLLQSTIARQVQAYGAFVIGLGLGLLGSALRRVGSPGQGTLAVGFASATLLLLADVLFVARAVVPRTYLGAVALELVLVVGRSWQLRLDRRRALREAARIHKLGSVYRPMVRAADASREDRSGE